MLPGCQRVSAGGCGAYAVTSQPTQWRKRHGGGAPRWQDGAVVRRPYPTYRDQSYPPTAAVWRALRELRATPPGYASSGTRQKLFSAALEQSEQLFTAAASAGPASRPLVLFYGLSQAGRAIAACAQVPLDKCRLNGHGISTTQMDQLDLGSVIIKDKGKAGAESFTQVATMLGSRSLPEETRLADVWSAISEVSLWPLQSSSRPQLSISRADRQVTPNALEAMVSGLPGELQQHRDPKERAEAVRKWLADYPALKGYSFWSRGALPESGLESWDERQGAIGCRLTSRGAINVPVSALTARPVSPKRRPGSGGDRSARQGGAQREGAEQAACREPLGRHGAGPGGQEA